MYILHIYIYIYIPLLYIHNIHRIELFDMYSGILQRFC